MLSDMTEIGNQVALGVFLVCLLEYLKQSQWFRWLTPGTSETIKRWVNVGVAAAATIGISINFDGWTLVNGGDVHAHIPALGTMVHAVFDFGKQWGVQQYVYWMAKGRT